MTTMLPSVLSQVDELVQPEIRVALERIDERTRLVAGYQLGYWDATGEPTGRSGKGLRPALALLSARAAGQDVRRGLPAAVAVELVHNFSLLHDDVIDGDLERRHRPTAWAAFGIGPAILAGDAMLSLADEVLSTGSDLDLVPGLSTLHTAIRRLIAGQAADVAFEARADVTLDECLAMARDKTAALLACSATLGAVLCGAPPTVVDGLARYGERLGLAFQLVDDLLGIWGEPAVTGKPVLSDLRARKKSVPVVRALTSGGPAGDQLADLYASPGELSPTDLALAATLIEETGARDWTEKQADRLLTEALAELDQLGEPGTATGTDLSEVHADLVAIAHFMTGRDH
ncbi:polyprenyl synthetase family protein [Plantactinospora soyae]|uniref:Geranylgeranyl diphosphate synthase type I n=1 Tax=Plantactinospora soyae TaxID=1544732 RepID=A0A927R0D4_9ACTN|nr:polyprenyl synthetase family protein [Plantactinospora soyae]MBE1490082.1 geranylgeranyl diphosphate synthase type I [Plantactinospora soyae]